MSDAIRGIIEWIKSLWPFRIVEQWEIAGFYVFGKLWRRWPFKRTGGILGPGLYIVVPWFMEVRAISGAPGIVVTARRDIMLKDGRTLTFEASAWVKVVDFDLAMNSVESYAETTQEAIMAVLAEKLAEVAADRLEPQGRGRLLADLRRWVNEETMTFGVEVGKLRFTTFVLNARTLRLLQETGSSVSW